MYVYTGTHTVVSIKNCYFCWKYYAGVESFGKTATKEEFDSVRACRPVNKV